MGNYFRPSKHHPRRMQYSQAHVTQHTVLDQFSQIYDGLISTYRTPQSICGYVVCAVVEFLAQIRAPLDFFELQSNTVNAYNIMPFLQKAMKFIQNSRLEYAKAHNFEKKAMDNYMKDWVANYEIEDYLAHSVPTFYRNREVYFFRNVAWDHPDEVARVTHEQAERVQEQKPFTGQKYFVTGFNPKRNITTQQWKQQVKRIRDSAQGEGIVLVVVDVLGHFVTLVIWRNRLKILDSTHNGYKDRAQIQKIRQIITQLALAQDSQQTSP